ncbi:MAG TPA: DUF1501 domain-containing protein [Tepidisphaeraceae bacterium]|jgi:hypothetical protein|nr:DUF1501 domain-containing protein [Tepidisphaeraceae bacterium]
MMHKRNWSRRDFLKTASAATMAALAAGAPRVWGGGVEQIVNPNATADTLIVLWMGGGMAHTETFDPKRYSPFVAGMDSNSVLSTFPAIDTAVDNIKISQGFENIAKVMDRGTLIRSYKAGDLGFILHSRHQYMWHTGYAPPQTVAAPHIGAWIAKTRGPLNPALPAFIDIGQRLDLGEGEELKAFHTGGFFGSEYGPFMIPQPAEAMEKVRPPKGMSASRFQNREKFYKELVAGSPIGEFGSDYQKESLIRSLDNAHRLLNDPASKAFDLSLEPKESYDIYNTGRFGQGCLLAKRLTEAGARFIEVTTEYIPFLNWDTHADGHTTMVNMKKQIDAPIAQLVLDLEKSGKLDRTLIVVASEFSRDMMMEGKPENAVKNQVEVPPKVMDMKHYGMHRHFTAAGSVLMFGGGMKKGYLYGKTADERPCTTIENPMTIEDLHATIYTAMGVSPKLPYDVEKRPFYATKDAKGVARRDLFAKSLA